MDFLRHQMLSRQVCMDGHKYTFFFDTIASKYYNNYHLRLVEWDT